MALVTPVRIPRRDGTARRNSTARRHNPARRHAPAPSALPPLVRDLYGLGPAASSLRGPSEKLLADLQQARRPHR